MTGVGSPLPPVAAPDDARVPRPPFPKRLIMAALGLFGLAAVTALIALLAGYAAAISFVPLPPVLGLAGPAAGLMLLTGIFILAREGWAPVLTAILVLYGIVLGIVIGPSGWLYIIAFLTVGIIVGSVDPGVFPRGRPLLPRSRIGKVALGLVAVGAIALATPLLLADPLKPGDVRSPAWTGVIATAADRELTDGRRYGQYAEFLGGRLSDGDLILAGGTIEAPTWFWTASPYGADSDCFMTRDMGYDDGPTVVIRVVTTAGSVGLRVTKAPGFQADPVTDGRYTGAAPVIRDERLAAAGEPGDPDPRRGLTPPRAGYFCLDATGQVTSWDQGY
jgi:hypothetical protein